MTDTVSTMERFHQYTKQPLDLINGIRFDMWRIDMMYREGLLTTEQATVEYAKLLVKE